MKKSTLSTLLVSGLIAPTAMIGLTATGASAASLITIDDFNSQITNSSDTLSTTNIAGSSNTFTRTSLSNVAGGTRQANIFRGTGAGGSAQLQIFDAGGFFGFNQPAVVSGSTFSLNYSNIASANLDLTGFDYFSFDVADIDPLKPAQITLNVNGETAVKTVSALGELRFNFSDFNDTSSFNNITSLMLSGADGNSTSGFRFAVDSSFIAVDVPEPSALGGLLVFGLLGFATAKKRANKSEEN